MGHAQRFPALAVLCVGLLFLAGCANASGGSGPSSAPAATSPAPSPGKQTVDLSISIRANGQDESSKYTLRCAGATVLEPSGHPWAAEACALLARSPQIMEPAPAPGTQMCTEQYGGPATATISGTIDGKAASRNFDLTNGCGISAWNDALPLLVDQPTGNLQ